jgi:hypothetical protein
LKERQKKLFPKSRYPTGVFPMNDALAAPIDVIVDLCGTIFPEGGVFTAFAVSLLAIPLAWFVGAIA